MNRAERRRQEKEARKTARLTPADEHRVSRTIQKRETDATSLGIPEKYLLAMREHVRRDAENRAARRKQE